MHTLNKNRNINIRKIKGLIFQAFIQRFFGVMDGKNYKVNNMNQNSMFDVFS
jgi:hypothetical protein